MVPNFRCLSAREKFYPQIIAICVIHSIIVGLRLELSGLGRQWCFAMSNSGVVYSVSKLKFCYDKHGNHVLSFMSLWCLEFALQFVRVRSSSWVLSLQVVLQRMVLCYRKLRSHDPSLELQRVYFALIHGNSLFHVQIMLTSLLHTCELNIPGLRCEQMDKTRVTHRETKYHAAWAKCRHAWQDAPKGCCIYRDLLNMSVLFFFVCLLCSRWWIFMHQVVKMIMRWWQIMFFGLCQRRKMLFWWSWTRGMWVRAIMLLLCLSSTVWIANRFCNWGHPVVPRFVSVCV